MKNGIYRFSNDFLQRAGKHTNQSLIVEQSPHPYPNGGTENDVLLWNLPDVEILTKILVRVTATIHVPCAAYLLIDFDERTFTDHNRDYLMFSRMKVGGDDLGSFSGRFGGRKYRVEGERFIWSFLSDPSSRSKVSSFYFFLSSVLFSIFFHILLNLFNLVLGISIYCYPCSC